MNDPKFPVSENMLKPMMKLISLLAIINNPAPVFEDEIIASVYGIERPKLRKWLSLKGYDTDALPTEQAQAKTATKIDYFIAHWLLNGHLDAANDIFDGTSAAHLRSHKEMEYRAHWNDIH